jgi:outer membrane PBP1 activator LpoA protein
MEREMTMKITKILARSMWILLASFVLAGCSTKPGDELDMAGIAMEKAKSVEASVYAPQEWERAEKQKKEADALIDEGHYSEARDVLIDSIASYNEAEAQAQRRVESLQIEIKALQSSAETELKKIKQFYESPKAKPSVKKQIEEVLPRLNEDMISIKATLEVGDYMMARMEAQDAVRYMVELQKRLGIDK